MTAARVPLPCGCAVIASHRRGQVLVRCSGSDGSTPPEVVSIAPEARTACPGGQSWAVTAEEVKTVRYYARQVDLPGGGAA